MTTRSGDEVIDRFWRIAVLDLLAAYECGRLSVTRRVVRLISRFRSRDDVQVHWSVGARCAPPEATLKGIL